jgi:mannonate dehydratase
VKLGLHPDDPPVPSLRGLARILTSADAMARAIAVADSPAVGLTFCQGSFATMGEDVPALVHRFAPHIAFIHVRDVRGTAAAFTETFPDDGQTDMAAVFRAYRDIGFDGPIRPDHAPAMDGDPRHDGAVSGINVGYEANGMIYTVGFMKGLLAGVGA